MAEQDKTGKDQNLERWLLPKDRGAGQGRCVMVFWALCAVLLILLLFVRLLFVPSPASSVVIAFVFILVVLRLSRLLFLVLPARMRRYRPEKTEQEEKS